MEQEQQKPVQSTREKYNTMAFFVFSFVVNAVINVVDAAAEDILNGTTMATSVVYVCETVPYFLGSLLLPIFIHKIAPLWTVMGTFLLDFTGILLLALSGSPEIRLTGVCLIAFAISFGDGGFLSLTAHYEGGTASAYSAASGIGVIFGALYYTGKKDFNTLLKI